MEAEIFYQSTLVDAIPVAFLTPAACTEPNSTLTANEMPFLWQQQFKGQLGEICTVGHPELQKIYIGLGNDDCITALAKAVNSLPVGQYYSEEPLPHQALLVWALSQYKFDRYKESTAKPRILAIDSHQQLEDILCDANAVFTVRDLINTPTNDMGPAELAEALSFLALTHDATFQQWIGEELLSDNYPAIHAVGRAAHTPPRLLSLTFGDSSHPKVTLIGKGVCFDSGGLDLKSSSNMRLMKKDMGGAAQVVGLAQWLITKKLPIYVTVLIPAVENAIGSGAYRPGDILTMRNGLTVEIDNTDAEGRLIVADALVKASEDKPSLIIDFTTLTGAARVAVGTEISAMFTNSDTLANSLFEAANEVNDPVWRMPLFKGYNTMLDSNIAHLSNASASSYAGAITAALFLQHFIDKSIDWVHFDIMAWNLCNKPGKPEGGEAMAMRAVATYLLKRFGNK
jgi:leucyl aminopeptidase